MVHNEIFVSEKLLFQMDDDIFLLKKKISLKTNSVVKTTEFYFRDTSQSHNIKTVCLYCCKIAVLSCLFNGYIVSIVADNC